MSERAQLFGQDLWLVERAGGLDLLPDPLGDLTLAQGNDNIVQALSLCLRVRQGELAPLGWPAYGSRLYELIGEPNNTRTHIKLMAFARDAIERDPRVIEVTDITARAGERSVARVSMQVLLIDEPTPLNLIFDMNLEAL